MPFVIPIKLRSLSKSTRFSKYKNIEESRDFLLQKLKRKAMAKNEKRKQHKVLPKWRIITRYPYHEIAFGNSLEEMKAGEWAYIVVDLPQLMPPKITGARRHTWFLAHFTQLAVETNKAKRLMSGDEMRDAEGKILAPHLFDGDMGDDDYDDDDEGDSHSRVRSFVQRQQDAQRMSKSRSARSSDAGLAHIMMGSDGISGSIGGANSNNNSSSSSSSSAHNSSDSGSGSLAHAGGKGTVMDYEMSGRLSFVMCVMLTNLLALLTRDASYPAFCAGLCALNLSLFAIVVVRQPFTVGASVGKLAKLRGVEERSSASAAAAASAAVRLCHQLQQQQQLLQQRQQKQHQQQHKSKKLKQTASSGSAKATPSRQQPLSGSSDVEVDPQGNAAAAGSDYTPSGRHTSTKPAPEVTDVEDMGGIEEESDESSTSDEEDHEQARVVHTLPTKHFFTADATTHRVRTGPNYKKNKTKKASEPAMLEFLGSQCVRSNRKVDHIAAMLPFPDYRGRMKGDEDEAAADARRKQEQGETDMVNDCPRYFIVNFQIPDYAPANPVWGRNREDGPGYSYVSYWKITPEAEKELFGPMQDPAPQLYRRWVVNNAELHNRLKCIPKIMNVDDFNFGMPMRKMLTSYNAKPFLTGPDTHQFFMGPNYIEADVNVHKFCFLARKAQYGLMANLPRLYVEVAFVVEAWGDEEQPERILAIMSAKNVDPSKAPNITDFCPEFGDEAIEPS